MKATIQIGVRRQGRVVGSEGRYTPITQQEIEVPEDFTSKQLAVAITAAVVRAALDAECVSDEVDTVEFTVDFEEDKQPREVVE